MLGDMPQVGEETGNTLEFRAQIDLARVPKPVRVNNTAERTSGEVP